MLNVLWHIRYDGRLNVQFVPNWRWSSGGRKCRKTCHDLGCQPWSSIQTSHGNHSTYLSFVNTSIFLGNHQLCKRGADSCQGSIYQLFYIRERSQSVQSTIFSYMCLKCSIYADTDGATVTLDDSGRYLSAGAWD